MLGIDSYNFQDSANTPFSKVTSLLPLGFSNPSQSKRLASKLIALDSLPVSLKTSLCRN